jgi:hypothetical protein
VKSEREQFHCKRPVNVTVVPESDAIVIMPMRKGPAPREIKSTIRKTAKDYRKTLRKLA